jgi:hypothetical protein
MALLVICWTALLGLPPEVMMETEGRPFFERRAWVMAEQVKQVEFVVQTAQPPHLLVKAVAVLPAGEYDRIELVRVLHILEPRDGMQVFRVVAVPAADAKPAAAGAPPREVQVLHQWKNFLSEARWLRGVRVYATAGSVEKGWTQPAASGPQEPPKKERGSSGKPLPRDAEDEAAGGSRMARVKRWKLNLAYEDPKEFIKKLGELKIEVGARKANGRFLIYSDLATLPAKPKEMTIVEFQKYVQGLQWLWLVSHDQNTCENFAIGAGLDERPTTIFLFVPQDMEKAIVAAETKHHGLTEKEIKEKKFVTRLDVTRKEKGWEVKVIGSYVDTNLKYDK